MCVYGSAKGVYPSAIGATFYINAWRVTHHFLCVEQSFYSQMSEIFCFSSNTNAFIVWYVATLKHVTEYITFSFKYSGGKYTHIQIEIIVCCVQMNFWIVPVCKKTEKNYKISNNNHLHTLVSGKMPNNCSSIESRFSSEFSFKCSHACTPHTHSHAYTQREQKIWNFSCLVFSFSYHERSFDC